MSLDTKNRELGRRESILHAAVTFFFIVASGWLTWPLFARMSTGLSTNPDALLNHWALAWNFHILPQAPLDLFDANIFFPRPDTLAYSEHLFGVALLAAPAYLLSGNSVFAYNFAVAATFVLSGLGMYLLVMELTGSRWAAVFTGIFYLAAPFRFLHLLHIQLLSAQWFPFVFFFLIRFLKQGRPRQAVAATSFAILQILSCTYYALYLAMALALFGVIVSVSSLRPPRLLDRKRFLYLLAGAAVILVSTYPFARPYLRNRDRGFYRRYEDTAHFSADARDYLRPTSFNKIFYARSLPRHHRSEKALFPGFAVLIFAAMGLTQWKAGRSPHQRAMWLFATTLAPLAFTLSLGPQMEVSGETYRLPYHVFYRYVPGFGGMRVPARLSILVLLALGPLAGWGIAGVLSKVPRWRPWLGCAFVAIALFEYHTYSLARILPPKPTVAPIYSWLAAQEGDFGLLELPIHEDITRESRRLYNSTVHWKHLANGFSGWWPNDYWVLVGRMRYFPTARNLQFLEREVPVRFILVHYGEYTERQAQILEQNIERYRERMPVRARFETDAVYELLPKP